MTKAIPDKLIGFTKVSLIFGAGVVAGTGHPWYLIPAAVGCGAAWLFWGAPRDRPQAETVPESPRDAPSASTRADGRLELLASQVETMQKEQAKLREALRWQEKLLHQTTREPVGR